MPGIQRLYLIVLLVAAASMTACQPIQPPTPVPSGQAGQTAAVYETATTVPVTQTIMPVAAEEITATVEADPTADRPLQEGIQSMQAGDHDKAVTTLTEAIQLNPEFAVAYFFRGLSNQSLGDIEAAVRDLEEALRLDPTLGELLVICWVSGYGLPADPATATAELETALALVEPDSVLAMIIGVLLDHLRSAQ